MAKGEQKAKLPVVAMTVVNIAISAIRIGAQMLRRDPYDDDIQELAGDIAAHGLLQPVGVVALDAVRFQLLWGSRRLAAHVRLGRVEIPARICDSSAASEVVAIAARENLLRRDLTLREEIDAIRGLTTEGKSPSQIADLVSKSRAWVDRRLAFDAIDPEIRDHVLEGDLPLGHGEALTLVADVGARSYLLTHCLQHRPSLVSLRALVASLEATPSFGDAVEAGAAAAQPAAAQQQLHLACFSCREPRPLGEMIIIRCCAACAAAIADPTVHVHGSDVVPITH
jgi:ParB/RepB/Spo0J family partition protein